MKFKDAHTTRELCELLGLARSNVLARAAREHWQSRPRAGRGGGNEWLLSSMPEATRLLMASRLCVEAVPENLALSASPSLSTSSAPSTSPSPSTPAPAPLAPFQRRRAEARTAILLLARAFAASSGLAPTPALEAFAARYNAGDIPAEAWIREALPRVCRGSLANWDRAAKTSGAAALGGRHGQHRRGTGAIDSQPDVRDVVLGMLYEFPDVQARNVLDNLQALSQPQTAISLPSLRRLQQWLHDWKEANAELYAFVKAPDKWRGSYLASCGHMYELITRPNQRWEYDGTPADLLLADGKRYTIVGVIDVYSRRVKLLVTLRSTARAVAHVTWRCLVDWGIPEEAVTDNGKEFVARHMQQVFLDLDILPTVLPPFRPELKGAIERVFRTFSHDLLPLYPCYIGHNVATRQQIRERETFAKRLMDRKNPEELSLAVTPEALQIFCDTWADKMYMHRPHTGLKRKTPFEVQTAYSGPIRRLDEAGEKALAILLLPLAGKDGWYTVTKKGVNAASGQYVHALLTHHAGKRVQVRIDPDAPECAYIFEESGAFLCRAVNIKTLSETDRRNASAGIRRHHASHVKAQAGELRELAKKTDAAGSRQRIVNYHVARAEVIEAEAATKAGSSNASSPFPAPSTPITHTTPALEQCGLAATAGKAKAPTAHAEPVQAARAAARAQLAANAGESAWLPSTPNARNKLFDALEAALERGETLPPDQREWMRLYATHNERTGYLLAHGRLLPLAANA